MAKPKKPKVLPIIDEIRSLMRVAPFYGVDVRTSDGEVIRVIHPDYLYVAPNGVTVHVYDAEQHPYILNARQIVAVTAVRQKRAAS